MQFLLLLSNSDLSCVISHRLLLTRYTHPNETAIHSMIQSIPYRNG
jgi:hypothetical protein